MRSAHTSTCSDGSCSPSQIISEAINIGLGAVALCDHNILSGIGEFIDAAKNTAVEAVGGVEISTEHNGTELHVVGLFVQPDNCAPLIRLLEQIKQAPHIIGNRKRQPGGSL